MLMIPHENKPSMVAKVATVLGENSININNMQVAQKTGAAVDSESIMIISVDKEVEEKILADIKAINGIGDAKCINIA